MHCHENTTQILVVNSGHKAEAMRDSEVIKKIKYGPVVQMVRMLACHARGRGFDPHLDRQ